MLCRIGLESKDMIFKSGLVLNHTNNRLSLEKLFFQGRAKPLY